MTNGARTTAIEISGTYEPRPVRFLEMWQPGDWQIKVYGISARQERPPASLVAVAKELALKELPIPAVTGNRYGVGFLIVHQGGDGNYVLVDWWVGENMLKNHVFAAPTGRFEPEDFRYVTPTGLCACVWELHVMHFERTAWVTSVLKREGGPDLEEYLLQRFSGEV